MSEKMFNARFAQKYDTLTAWASSNIVLKAGEIAFATESVDTTVDGVVIKQPIVLAKIGDGSKTFSQLPYSFYAKASDVHGWAKKTEEDFLAWMATFIGEKVQNTDTNTTYAFEVVDSGANAGKLKITTTTHSLGTSTDTTDTYVDIATQAELDKVVEDLTKALNDYKAEIEAWQVTNTAAIAKAQGDAETNAANALAGAKSELEGKIKLKADQTALDAVSAVAEAATTVSEVDAQIDTKITALNLGTTYEPIGAEDRAKSYVDQKFTDADLEQYTTEQEVKNIVDGVIAGAADSETYNSLTKLVDYIDTHGGEAADMAQAIDTLEGKVETIEGKPAYGITATQISNWDNEVGAKALAETKTTAAEVKTQIEAYKYATEEALGAETTARGKAITDLTNGITNGTIKAGDADKLGGYEPSYYVSGLGLAQTLADYVTLEEYNANNGGIANSIGAVDTKVTNLDDSLAPVAKSGKLSDLDKTFGEGITDIIFDAGNASGYNA